MLPVKRRGLTEFTYSRFLTPWLANYEGYSLFLDSDILILGDVVELLAYPMAEPDCDVYVAKNVKQFEWASVMLFNNSRCQILTPEYVDDSSHALFDFAWSSKVGTLPPQWNHLSNYDPARADARLVHYTQGIPCWPETEKSDYAEHWLREFRSANSTVSFEELMGKSVHAEHVYKRLANG